MEKQQYKNSLKSKKMIKEAFLHLISNKDISQIRIREIIELADISKGTFYAHYHNLYAVLEDIENENIERLTLTLSENSHDSLMKDFTPFINELFLYIEENKHIYQNIFKSNIAPAFLNKLQKVFVDYMMKDANMLSNLKSKKEAKLFFSFIAVGTATLIYQHIVDSEQGTLKELISTLNGGILHGASFLTK